MLKKGETFKQRFERWLLCQKEGLQQPPEENSSPMYSFTPTINQVLLAIIIINTNIYYIELYYTSNEFPIIC
jgi:hypothetical protein